VLYLNHLGRCAALSALAACGSVKADLPADASPDVGAGSGSGSSACASQPVITDIEEAVAGYGNACARGGWTLESFNGTTSPAVAKPDNSTLVAPIALAADSNPLDPTSRFAIHVSGSGQHNVPPDFSFAQLAASLNQTNDDDGAPIDASAYTGVQFLAKVTAGASGIRLTVSNIYTDPVGGKCTPNGTAMNDCYDDAGMDLAMTGAIWTKFNVPFAQLTQYGYGNPSPLGASFPRDAITRIQWEIGIPDTGNTEAWELWIDDLRFY
jgi:hypothetical protein